MKIKTIIVAGIIILSSCERETHINIPTQPAKLVTESLQGQNSYAEARIVRTRGVTDPIPPQGMTDPYVVKNVIALLFEDDIFKDTLKYDSASQKYKARLYKVQAGKTYKLALSAPNYANVEGVSFTPTFVPINSLSYTRNARVDANGNQQDEVKISFADLGAIEDYYLIRIKDPNGYYLDCVNTNDKDVEKLAYDDPINGGECLQSDRLSLSDVNFNGSIKTVAFYTESGRLEPVFSPSGARRAIVELLHINRDYFKYIRSLNNYENAVGNPFAEPVNLYSNIKNGYGMFTTYAIAVDSIR